MLNANETLNGKVSIFLRFPRSRIISFILTAAIFSVFEGGLLYYYGVEFNAPFFLLQLLLLAAFGLGVKYSTNRTISYVTVRRLFAMLSVIMIIGIISMLVSVLVRDLLGVNIFEGFLGVLFLFSFFVLNGEFVDNIPKSTAFTLFFFLIALLPVVRPVILDTSYVTILLFVGFFIILIYTINRLDGMGTKELGIRTTLLLRAALDAWLSGSTTSLEEYFDSRSKEKKVKTYALTFSDGTDRACVVVPPMHPGPFKGVGSYNLPEEINKVFTGMGFNDCIVLHSTTNHDSNAPSRKSMAEYLSSLKHMKPTVIKLSNAHLVNSESVNYFYSGLSSDKASLIIISPKRPSDDFPPNYLDRVYKMEEETGKALLLADGHNNLATGNYQVITEEIEGQVKRIVNDNTAQCNISLSAQSLGNPFPLEIGSLGIKKLHMVDEKTSLDLLIFDSNNIVPGVAQRVREALGDNSWAVTTDTHFNASHALNGKGYWALGDITPAQYIIDHLKRVSEGVMKRVEISLLVWEGNIKLMGQDPLDNLKKAERKGMRYLDAIIGIMVLYFLMSLLLI
ncbi:MAG: DUF2070 family protein [Nitrososphaerota archaeon]|jgi:predicted neutral ceramidase superfamily lipid hydrolase|nr:DUF2070 family protein [Nitrososphaerota archaeon]MDG7037570.1 DUF2070 family protein [Nitrososphaerota archaeon]MDG7042585.1 DUF2070 family protein [Nitrososphaerota archaeon]